MPSMLERYEEEVRDRDPSTLEVIYLDNSTGGEITGINDKMTSLLSLSLVNCGLKSLKGFPSLPALTHLDLSDNDLGDEPEFDTLVKNAPELQNIVICGNKFTSLEVLRPLKMLTKLTELDVSNTPDFGPTASYRTKIFEMLPVLKVLNGCDQDGEEVEEDFFGGEGAEDSDDDIEDEDDGPGLSYLDRSQFSDDETDDYTPKEGDDSVTRGTKRAANEEDKDEEPDAKKGTSDN